MSKLLLYCTKAKPMLRVAKEEFKGQKRTRCYSKEETKYFTQYIVEDMYEANGKIVAECDFEVERIKIVDDDPLGAYWYETDTLDENTLLEKSCLSSDELFEYLGEYNEGYAIHIKNLHIFDEPRELSEYARYLKVYNCLDNIKVAPQNMMWCYEDVGITTSWTGFNNNTSVEKKIIISIKPEWLCKILNGEKTIEVRKKVLKGMLE